MKKFLRITVEILIEAWCSFGFWLENNLRSFAILMELILPYAMLIIGQKTFEERGVFAVGGEVFIPVIVMFVVTYIRSYTNKIGKGSKIPRPAKRFTEVSDDGEVSVDFNRQQEMILYLADLEDWMERKGYFR